MMVQESSEMEDLRSKCIDLQEQHAALKERLLSSRRQCSSLQQSHSQLETELAHSEEKTEDLNEQNRLYFFTIMDLEARHIIEQQISSRLALSNAEASESIAQLEDRDDLLVSLNDSLAAANAHSAEVVCELQARADRLSEALERVRVLQGIISICMHCHNIRDDGDVWNRLEEYMMKHSDVRFSHGLCPPCLDEHYSED